MQRMCTFADICMQYVQMDIMQILWRNLTFEVCYSIDDISLGAFAASKLDVVFSGYQPC
jgi:hypothetical protein